MSELASAPNEEAAPTAVAFVDCSPAQHIEQRYLTAAIALVDDAVDHRSAEILVEVLTWTLAWIAVDYSTPATGDILRRLDGHMADLAGARQRAQLEVEQAKKKGFARH